ncbi:hypothetical protein [Aneurinibacillus sp. REN35]
MSMQTTVLGEVEYQGEIYTAVRVIDDDIWKLIFVNGEESIIMLTH